MSNKVKIEYGKTPVFEMSGYPIGVTVGHVITFKPDPGETLELDADYTMTIGDEEYTTADPQLTVDQVGENIRVTFVLDAGIITDEKTHEAVFRSESNSAPEYLKAILKITGIDC